MVESDIVSLTRTIQASSATIDVDEEGDVRMVAPSPKVSEFWEFWNEDYNREPFVLMAGGPGSRQLLELASEFLVEKGVQFSKVVGGMDGNQRSEEVERFMLGETNLLLGQTTAAGEGINLERAAGLGFLQRPMSLIENIQAEDRIRRASQQSDSILIVDFVTKDTFDDRIGELYADNKAMFDDVLRDPNRIKELL